MPRKSGRREKGTGGLKWRDGNLYVRLRFQENGETREVLRRVPSNLERDGRELLKRMATDLQLRGASYLEAATMTFNALADFFETNYLQPAVYTQDGRKIAGRRSLAGLAAQMRALRRYFGAMRVRDITFADLEQFKVKRLAEPKERGGGTRTITDVNRTLALMRKMLNVAKRQQWIAVSPFECGDPIIKLSEEKKGGRILSYADEAALLAWCIGIRAHLRPLVICGLDTGMRFGEIRDLTWANVDLTRQTIKAVSYKGDARRERILPMTSRLWFELKQLWGTSDQQPATRVFGICDNVRHSFATVCRLAGLDGITPHDLRHTFCSRLAQGNLSITEIMRLSGHTQVQTLARYTHADTNTFQRALQVLERLPFPVSDLDPAFIS